MARRILIAKTDQGNHIRIHENNYIGESVLTRRNTVETIVHIYDDGRREKVESKQQPLFAE